MYRTSQFSDSFFENPESCAVGDCVGEEGLHPALSSILHWRPHRVKPLGKHRHTLLNQFQMISVPHCDVTPTDHTIVNSTSHN